MQNQPPTSEFLPEGTDNGPPWDHWPDRGRAQGPDPPQTAATAAPMTKMQWIALERGLNQWLRDNPGLVTRDEHAALRRSLGLCVFSGAGVGVFTNLALRRAAVFRAAPRRAAATIVGLYAAAIALSRAKRDMYSGVR